MELKDVEKALGASAEGCTVALVDAQTVQIEYPTLDVCSEKHPAHMAALAKVAKIKSAEIDAVAGSTTTEYKDAGAMTGPQRFTLRFLPPKE